MPDRGTTPRGGPCQCCGKQTTDFHTPYYFRSWICTPCWLDNGEEIQVGWFGGSFLGAGWGPTDARGEALARGASPRARG